MLCCVPYCYAFVLPYVMLRWFGGGNGGGDGGSSGGDGGSSGGDGGGDVSGYSLCRAFTPL